MRSRLSLLVSVAALGAACATHTWYRRAPEDERSAALAHSAIRNGMSLADVVQSMVEVRSMHQVASLTFSCANARVHIVLNAEQELFHSRSTRVSAADFATIWEEDFQKQSLKTYGFERQGKFLATVRARGSELQPCETASLAFDTTTEGACGDDTIEVSFGPEGRLTRVGAVQVTACVP
jgi:hypothetical protein